MVHRIDEADLKTILSQGENESIEFKLDLPPPHVIARNLAAFANSNGGTVLFGIRDNGSVAGADIEVVQRALGKALHCLSPPPRTIAYHLPHKGKSVVAVDVEPSSSGPVFAEGSALVRVGSVIKPITPQQIISLVRPEGQPPAKLEERIDQLAKMVANQTETVEALREQLAEASKWQKKVPDWIWGGLIGAIIGLILAVIFGIG